MINSPYFLAGAVVAAFIALGATRLFFTDRQRGLSASQYLLAVLLWGVMMAGVWVWLRY